MSWVILIFLILCAAGGGAVYLWVVQPEKARELKNRLGASASLRLAVIAVVTLVMLIPLEFVEGVVDERSGRYQSVLREIAGIWGGEQRLVGPFLIVPYEYKRTQTVTHTRPDGEQVEREKTTTVHDRAVFLPEALNLDVNVVSEERKRGIYRSRVYRADATLKGRFAKPDFAGLPHTPSRIDWASAYLSLGISDTRAINDGAALDWNGARVPLAPGTRYATLLPKGLHAAIPGLDAASSGPGHAFSLALQLNGSGGFFFSPVGRLTVAKITSPWPDPSFQGSFLPSDSEIGSDGFSADWRIPHLARTFPQRWTRNFGAPQRRVLAAVHAGVRLFEPAGLYRATVRAVKYGILFVGLTFMALYLFEFTAPLRLGFVQYGLIGGALCLFYLLLISLAEHIGFRSAYLGAAGTVATIIALYAGVTLASRRAGVSVFALLAAVYGLLYVVLHQQDFALLLGTGMLFVVLVVAMYLTRRLNGVVPGGEPKAQPMA